nr:FixH family protein [Chloroflexaceae bacterium]
GSMDACHCSGPSRQSDMFQTGGERKIDIAKEAMVQAATVLTPQDKLGVVAFDDDAETVLDPTQGITGDQVANSVANMEPRGGTRVRAGLRAAEEMLDNTDARIKHVILLTDGWGHGGDNLDLAQQMRDKGMTLTVVAAGSGSAEYLEQLAQTGGGRYYPTEHMSEVPQIFLQETVTTLGNYIVEQPITPAVTAESPVLSGITSFPTLYGYNGTTMKETARQVLAAGNQAPLLATWQFGLGRAAAWTSDTNTRWGRDLVAWPEFPRFASQMMSWILPTRSGQNVNTEVRVSGGRAEITVGLGDENGPTRSDVAMTATVIGSDGSRQEVPLTQVAPGQYRGSLSSPATGTYLVQIAGSAEGRAVVQETAGLVVPYSAEYRQDQANPALLTQLRELTKGTELNFTNAAAAFAATNERVSRAQEIGLPLLWLALLLLPLDIAVRRLLLWSRGKNRSTKNQEPRTKNQEQIENREPSTETRGGGESGNPSASTNPDDPLARLQAARDRARRRLKGED